MQLSILIKNTGCPKSMRMSQLAAFTSVGRGKTDVEHFPYNRVLLDLEVGTPAKGEQHR